MGLTERAKLNSPAFAMLHIDCMGERLGLQTALDASEPFVIRDFPEWAGFAVRAQLVAALPIFSLNPTVGEHAAHHAISVNVSTSVNIPSNVSSHCVLASFLCYYYN
jgi:hypothetical protein